jgi:NTP pyrophosphatase (non-canonical NTP hydrolase)
MAGPGGKVNANEYQEQSMRTAPKEDLHDAVLIGGLGIAGEAGEIVERIKKWAYHGHEISPEVMREEIGDLLWYVAYLSSALGLELGDIMEKNVAKLEARYPDGFSHEASRNRPEKLLEQIPYHKSHVMIYEPGSKPSVKGDWNHSWSCMYCSGRVQAHGFGAFWDGKLTERCEYAPQT